MTDSFVNSTRKIVFSARNIVDAGCLCASFVKKASYVIRLCVPAVFICLRENMANRTVKDAKSVRGTNPQYLIEKIIRSRIYDSKFWKEECFALSAELVVDKAMELRFIGGVFGGNIKPTPFLCLVLKMLQIQPEKDIVVEFIKNEEFKYVRALGAFYMRLVGSSLDCYKYLEPLLNDGRKLRFQNNMGQFVLIHMDEFIDDLLREERLCDVILPRIQKRQVLEENNELEPKVSVLEDDLDDGVESSADEDEGNEPTPPPPEKVRRTSPEHGRSPDKDRGRERDRRHRSRERDRDRHRHDRDKKHRSRSRERDTARDRDVDHERDRRHRSKSPRRERDRDRGHRPDMDRSWKERDDKRHRDRGMDRDNRNRGRDRDRDRDRPKY